MENSFNVRNRIGDYVCSVTPERESLRKGAGVVSEIKTPF